MRRLTACAFMLTIGCEQSTAEPFEVAALSPNLLIPGDTVSATIEGSGTAISIDYGEGKTSAQWATAELIGGGASIPLTLDPIAEGRFDAILPADLVHPSDQYSVVLHGREDHFEFPVRILDLETKILGCPTDKTRLVSIGLSDALGQRIAPDHPIEVRISGTVEVKTEDCRAPAALPGVLGPASTLEYCIGSGNAGSVVIEAGALAKTVEIRSPSVSPVLGPIHVSAGECVPLELACPDCATLVPLEITTSGDSAPRVTEAFGDPECLQATTLGDRPASELYVKAPATVDTSRLQVRVRGCETQLNLEVVVHPRLVTIPVVAIGVPFPVQIPNGCGALTATNDVVLTSQAAQAITDRFYVASIGSNAPPRFRISCDAVGNNYLSGPIELSTWSAPMPLGRMELEPAAIAGSAPVSHVRFHFNRLVLGAPTTEKLSAVVLSPGHSEPLIFNPPIEACASELCLGIDYTGAGTAEFNRPELIKPVAYAYDQSGCVTVQERALIRATDEEAIFRFGSTNRLDQVVDFINSRLQNEMPVITFARGLVLTLNGDLSIERPVFIAGDGARLGVSSLNVGPDTSGSFLSGLDVECDFVEVKGNGIVIRDSTIGPRVGGNSQVRLSLVGDGIDLGPGNRVRAEGATAGVGVFGGEARIHDLEITGGELGLHLEEPAAVDQVVITKSRSIALRYSPGGPKLPRLLLSHLTIDSDGFAFEAESALAVGGSIVRAALGLTTLDPTVVIAYEDTWAEPAPPNGPLPGAPMRIVPQSVFVAPIQGDYRLNPGAFPIDRRLGNPPADRNGVLPGSFNGEHPDLGARESLYSPP